MGWIPSYITPRFREAIKVAREQKWSAFDVQARTLTRFKRYATYRLSLDMARNSWFLMIPGILLASTAIMVWQIHGGILYLLAAIAPMWAGTRWWLRREARSFHQFSYSTPPLWIDAMRAQFPDVADALTASKLPQSTWPEVETALLQLGRSEVASLSRPDVDVG